MKKVLLISRDMWMLPFSLAYIGALFKRHSIEYDVAPIESAAALGRFDLSSYSAIGISAMVMDFDFVQAVGAVIKEQNPDIPVILGGRISVAPDRLLAQLPIDYMVINDANPTFVELLNALDNGSDPSTIKGLILVKEGKLTYTPSKKLPILDGFSPCWDGVEVQPYLENLSNPAGYPVLTGLGCYGNCHYCAPGYKAHRNRPVDLVLEEMIRAAASYEFEVFSFMSEVFYPSVKLVTEFCRKYRASGLKHSWLCMLRADFNPDLLPLMVDSGCVTINIGMESFDDDALMMMGKRTNTSQIDRLVSKGQELGIQVLTNVMIGNLGDSVQSVNRTIDYIISKKTKCIYAIPLISYPGTHMYDLALESGKIKDEDEYVTLMCQQDEAVSLYGNEYPNMSTMTLEDFRRVYANANYRCRASNYHYFSPRTFDIETSETWCPKCNQPIGIEKAMDRLGEMNINCPHCMNVFPFNLVFAWVMGELAGLELQVEPGSKIGMICPQNFAQILAGALDNHFLAESLEFTIIADSVTDVVIKDIFCSCTLDKVTPSDFDAIFCFGLLSPSGIKQRLIDQGFASETMFFLDSKDHKSFLRRHVEDDGKFFIPNFFAQDIKCFGEDIACMMRERFGSSGVIGIAPSGGYAQNVARGMADQGLKPECYIDLAGQGDPTGFAGVPFYGKTDVDYSNLDCILVLTPSIAAQSEIKRTLVHDMGVENNKIITLQEVLLETWLKA